MMNTLLHSSAQRKRIAERQGCSWQELNFDSCTGLQCVQVPCKILERTLLHTVAGPFELGYLLVVDRKPVLLGELFQAQSHTSSEN